MGAFGGRQTNRLGQFARDWSVEAQRHRANRQTGGLRVFALATETGGKGLADLKAEALLYRVGNPRTAAAKCGRAHPLAIDQLHFGRRRQAPVAGERHKTQGLPGGKFRQVLGFEQRVALRTVDQSDRYPLTQAVNFAPDMIKDAFQRGRAVELQHEILVFVDALVGAGQ